MESRLSTLLFWLLVQAVTVCAVAQEAGWVVIQSNVDDAIVVVDSVSKETWEGQVLSLPAGRHSFSLLPPLADSWYFSRPTSISEVVAGDTSYVDLNFSYIYRVESRPFGADVLLASEDGHLLLGSTPLVLRRDKPITDEIHLKKEGYLVERLSPGDDVFNQVDVMLRPNDRVASSAKKPIWTAPRSGKRWISYSAAALAVASGAVAVHYKMKADDVYDKYELTGDPNLRPEIRRYDTYSAIALGGMQVGVGLLAIRLILK